MPYPSRMGSDMCAFMKELLEGHLPTIVRVDLQQITPKMVQAKPPIPGSACHHGTEGAHGKIQSCLSLQVPNMSPHRLHGFHKWGPDTHKVKS